MGVADGKFLTARLYKPLTTSDEGTPVELACEGQNLNRLMRDHGFAVNVTPASSPKRGAESSTQNGVGGPHGQPRQQRQMPAQQNRQQMGQGQNRQAPQQQQQQQPQQQQNRPQGQIGQQQQNRQLENAQREIKALKSDIASLDKNLLCLKTENVS